MRLAAEPDDDERERWAWAGESDPLEQVRAVCRTYDDEALLREFLTPKVCEQARLFAYEHVQSDPRRIRVSSRECDVVRDVLIAQHSRFGIPHIEIVDADFGGGGQLHLRHREEVALDPEYARGTLVQMASLWGRPVVAETTGADDETKWFVGRPDGTSAQLESAP